MDAAGVLLATQVDEPSADFVLCVQIDGKDPPSQIVAGLQRANKIVVPGSECQWVPTTSGSYYLRTHHRAYIINVHNAKWLTGMSFQVQVDKLHTAKWGAGFIAKMAQNGDKWIVIELTSWIV